MLKWDTAWRALCDAAGLHRLRFHDLWHTVITELAEMRNADRHLARNRFEQMVTMCALSKRWVRFYSQLPCKNPTGTPDIFAQRQCFE